MNMKRSRFTESQILAVLHRLQSGETVAELCEQYGISASTLYGWRARHRRISIEDEEVVHRVQKENRRLRRIIVGMIEESDKLKGMIRSSGLKSPNGLSTIPLRSDDRDCEEH